ncbi:von Willebrand factor A domain-containing protein 7 isoform X2 [Xenopus laevis]|nr:von Willebrand factor A domain-containing protein 7 isoform X2 [Xenopus laevis]
MAISSPMLLFLLLLVAVVIPGSHSFFPNFWSKFLSFTWGSYTHQDLTEEAILNITLQILLDNPHPFRPELKAQDFQGKTLTADAILGAYFGEEVSPRQFRASLRQIVSANANMDFLNGTRDDPLCHFDSERLKQGNWLLLRMRDQLLGSLKAKEYEGARDKLGQILHSLQDFYSHTNWVEMGNTDIHPDLATPGRDIRSIAGLSDETCTDCTELSCKNNIVQAIEERQLLTSGYYGDFPKKPHGKCSHGGPFDDSRLFSARGGINKDTAAAIFSPHHFLHQIAAELALKASIKFLNELRDDVTDREMLRILGVSASPALSFVMDTTGSMGEEITTARLQSRHIIQRQRQTLLYPDFYILVPFNDPDYGPVYKTSDPNEFLRYLDDLQALGGGDEPEMCLSALQLALIHTPPNSEIFVFTDASSKDAHLKSSVEALIQERKIKVSFLVTEDPSRTRVRSRRELLPQDRFDLYANLSEISGGQIIFTNNQDIPAVSEVISESVHFDVVTLFHKQSMERGSSTHEFQVDDFMRSVCLFINGDVSSFKIHDPTGKIQHGNRQSNGKFTRVSFKNPLAAGRWKIEMRTTGPHTLHIQGRSLVDFLYYFGVPVTGSHPGLYKLSNQPVSGVSAILVVDVIGLPDSAHLDHVTITPVKGVPLKVELEPANQTGLLVAQVGQVPLGEFSIGVSGQDGKGSAFLREAPQHGKSAECVVEITNESPLMPGEMHWLSLSISSYGASPCYTIKMSNDRGYRMNTTIPRVFTDVNETHETGFWIQAPDEAETNTVVTVTAQAEACEDKAQNCFTLLPLIIMARPEVYSLQAPVCSLLSYSGSCPLSLPPRLCQQHQWRSVLHILDPGGVKYAQILSGFGSISHGPDGTSERVEYSSDCCFPKAEILLTNYWGATSSCLLTAPFSASNLGHCTDWILLVVMCCSSLVNYLLYI